MSNVAKHIKKSITTKVINMLTLIVFFGLVVYISPYLVRLPQYGTLVSIIMVLVVYYFLSKFIDSRLDKWVMPELSRDEQLRVNIFDTMYRVGLVLFALYFSYAMLKVTFMPQLAIGAGIILGLTEYSKWKKFNRTMKEVTDNGQNQ